MMIKHAGWWPLPRAMPQNMQFFRHTRICLREEVVGGGDVHTITVAVLTVATGGDLKTTASIVAVGSEGEGGKCWTLPFSEEHCNEVVIADHVKPEHVDHLPVDFSEGLKHCDPEALNSADEWHDIMVESLAQSVAEGNVGRLPPPPEKDQGSYAW